MLSTESSTRSRGVRYGRTHRSSIAPEITDPWYGLSTHPDIIEIMWKLDDELPQRCRWVFWGRPALVHPETVVFAVGFGTIGHVMRLPQYVREAADPRYVRTVVSGNPGQFFDIGPAGPKWRFISAHAGEAEWSRAAYEFAGTRVGQPAFSR
jgi:hypothetical protein